MTRKKKASKKVAADKEEMLSSTKQQAIANIHITCLTVAKEPSSSQKKAIEKKAADTKISMSKKIFKNIVKLHNNSNNEECVKDNSLMFAMARLPNNSYRRRNRS